MTKFLVFSDSHGYISNMTKAVEKYEEIDYIIHLGDYYRDVEELKRLFPQKNILTVKGNNEFRSNPGLYSEILSDFENIKVFMTHGHSYNVKTELNKLFLKGKSVGCDLILYGHTHMPFLEKKDEISILNPGSIAPPRFASESPSFAIVYINKFDLNCELLRL